MCESAMQWRHVAVLAVSDGTRDDNGSDTAKKMPPGPHAAGDSNSVTAATAKPFPYTGFCSRPKEDEKPVSPKATRL